MKIFFFCSSDTDLQTVKEKVVMTEDCQLVTLMNVVSGRLEITTTHVYFYDTNVNNNEGNSFPSENIDGIKHHFFLFW